MGRYLLPREVGIFFPIPPPEWRVSLRGGGWEGVSFFFPFHYPSLLLECPLLLVPSRLPKYGSVFLVQLGEGG